MYSVSDEYIAALRRPVKYDRITGQIRLADGTRIEINNNVVVQGKLSITRSVCGSSFDIGAFNAARMSITIKDEAAYDHEFGNATIVLEYGLMTDVANEVWEDVPLGVFYVDGHYTTRSGKTVSLQAFDSAGKFEVEPPKLDGVTTLYGALQQACLKANVGLAITETEFNTFPNAAVVPGFTRARIQSCRDIVIWVAQAAGASAFIDRNNMLTLKRYYYAGGDVYNRLFTANERSKIKFTDTRTYFAYLSNYCAGEPKMYSNILSFTGADAPHVKEGGLTLPENPLLLALTAEEQDAANMALMKNYSAPTRYIKATGTADPAIDPLDVVAFENGSIDIGQIISVCTKIQWKYRGSGYIECNNFDEYSVDNSASAAVLADTETQTDTNYARTPPKSQTQKEIDELKAGHGGAGDTYILLTETQAEIMLHDYKVVETPSGVRYIYGQTPSAFAVDGNWAVDSTSFFEFEQLPLSCAFDDIYGNHHELSVETVKYKSYLKHYITWTRNGETFLTNTITDYDTSGIKSGFGMYYSSIHSPTSKNPNGYVTVSELNFRSAASTGVTVGTSINYNKGLFKVYPKFASMEEYRMAAAITETIETKPVVNETITKAE